MSAVYSWVAFGRPWRIPQHYDLFSFPGVNPAAGILGIQAPNLTSIRLLFVGDRGLLVVTPIVVAAAAGLWLLYRRGLRAEALLCAAVAAAFIVGECGYGDPYGGTSAGPRYLIPALPFLMVGLAPAFARWRLLTVVLAVVSIAASLVLTVTWAQSGFQGNHYRDTVWGEVARTVWHPSRSRLSFDLAKNVVDWAGASAPYGSTDRRHLRRRRLVAVAATAAEAETSLEPSRRLLLARVTRRRPDVTEWRSPSQVVPDQRRLWLQARVGSVRVGWACRSRERAATRQTRALHSGRLAVTLLGDQTRPTG